MPIAPISNPSGLPDFQVNILSVGAIDPFTGNFIPKGTLRSNERAAVRFVVKNIGDKASGPWTYNAELPTYPRYIYKSRTQSSLMPGAQATVTVAFDKLVAGQGTVIINVDPYNMIAERLENNNRDARYYSVY